jgi:hypothetical protein
MARKCDQDFISKCKNKYGAKAYTYYNDTKGSCMCGKKVTVNGEERIIGPGGIRVEVSKEEK